MNSFVSELTRVKDPGTCNFAVPSADQVAFLAFAMAFLANIATRNGKRKRETETRLRFLHLWNLVG